MLQNLPLDSKTDHSVFPRTSQKFECESKEEVASLP